MTTAVPEAAVQHCTIVFTDIVGFTEFTALRGDAEALQLLSVQERIVRETLPQDARIVKELGDGLLISFRNACEALETSLRLQEQYENLSDGETWSLWVRIGMHSGAPRVKGDDIVGHDVNVARRVVEVAGPGEVLLSEATLDEIGPKLDGVLLDELGPVVMKGIPEPVRLYRAQTAA